MYTWLSAAADWGVPMSCFYCEFTLENGSVAMSSIFASAIKSA
jgi:hypothetical protein